MLSNIAQFLNKRRLHLNESLAFEDANCDFWYSNVIDEEGNAVSGGFASTRIEARQIAISELLERSAFHYLQKCPLSLQKKWGLDIHPTACGFAGGFDKHNTVLRSISEAAERWIMSNWIDKGLYIAELSKNDVLRELDSISIYLINQFEEVRFFKKTIAVEFGSKLLHINVAQTMGILEGGIFPGSSAQTSHGSIWQHALVESVRHLLGHKNNPPADSFPANKVKFFAKNAKLALNKIGEASNHDWPRPKILLQKKMTFLKCDFHVVRTIFDGWLTWSEGPIERFLF